MFARRRPCSGAFVWTLAIISIWIGWPNTGCVCADGGYRIFCDAHRQESPSTPPDHPRAECCQHRDVAQEPVRNHDCCDRFVAGAEIAGPGCTPVVNSPVLAPTAPVSETRSLDHAVTLYLYTAAFAPSVVGFAAIHGPTFYTVPPVDLVITLHCILI